MELWVNKLQKYRQNTIAKRKSNRLERRFFEPFKVTERIEKVAYRLQLPTKSKIYDIFHISVLKKFVGKTDGEESAFPRDLTNIEDNVESEEGGADTDVPPYKHS